MKYMGSKARIADEILPIILADREPDQLYIEPFVGGCNTIDKVTGKRVGIDINPYLITMWDCLVNGWLPHWVRKLSKNNKVFCSEYKAPPDFKCVWEKPVKSSLSANGRYGKSIESIERLFVWAP